MTARIPNFRRGTTTVRSIYCISAGPGCPVKVGISVQPTARLQTLRAQRGKNLQMYWTGFGDFGDEREAHRLLADRRIEGEWFADPDDAIKGIVPGLNFDVLTAIRNALCAASVRAA